MARLSTHVLDTSTGRPAGGVALVLSRLSDRRHRTVLGEFRTNGDGRTEAPLLTGERIEPGLYEIAFQIGDYFRALAIPLPDPPFLDVVPIRFGIADPAGHYHVPLLVSPWSFSTYRGS